MLNWIPKSTPRPTNSTANATEIGLKAPASISPTAVVIASPSISAIDTAAMIFGECSAIHRMNSTITQVTSEFITMPSCVLPNSSLAIATGPVRRTRA